MSTALLSSRKSANARTKPSFYPAHLRCAAALGLGLLSLGVFAGQPAHAGTVSWSGGDGSWFGNPSQWSNGSTPGTTDDAKNLTSALITLDQSTTIQSFFSDGAFNLTGGTFSGSLLSSASTLQVNSTLTVNGGGIANFTINKGADGSVVFSTSGGNFLSNDIVNADLNLSAPVAYVRLVNTNTFNGAISLGASGGNGIHLQDGNSTMVVGKTGSLTGFGGVAQDNGGATFTNNGTVNANAVGKALTLAVSTFNNTGTTEATNGATLNLYNTNTNAAAGSTLAAKGAGSVISLSGIFTGTGNNLLTASSGGQIQVNGASLLGTINTDANTALVFSTSGSNLVNNTTVNGNLDLSSSVSYLRLVDADTVNGNIALGASGGNGLHLQDGNSVFTLNGSLIGFGGVVQDNGGAMFTNNGTVNANSTGNALTLALTTFNNVGTAEATNGGTLALDNTSTNNTGLLAATNGGVLDISGTLNSNAGNSINGVGGTVNVLGASLLGTINETAGTSLVFNTSGSNLMNGTTVNGNLDLSNSISYLRLVNADTVNGNIALGASGGDGLHLQDGNSVFVLNGNLTGFGGVAQDNGGATFTNNGTVNANAVGKALTLAVSTFNNTGTTEATNGATLNLYNTNTNAAAGSTLAAKGAGSVISLSGIFTGTGNNLLTASSGGQIQVNGASLLGTINTDANTALVFSTSGSNLVNNTTVNGNLDLSSSVSYLRLVDADTVNGNIALGASGGNGLHLQDGNSVFTLNGSLIGFGGVVQDNGGAMFISNKTIDATGGTLSLATTNFTNNGTAEATNGATLEFNNTNSLNNGAVEAIGAGSVASISGIFTGAGSNLMTASDGGQIQVHGATLTGTINTSPTTALIFDTNGGNILTNATINGNLDLSNSTAYVRVVNADTVNGNIALGASGGNGLHLQDGNSTLTLGKTGSLTGFGGVVQDNGGAAFVNKGTVNANSVGNTLTLNTSTFTNTGTTEVQNGSELSVGGATADSGNVLVKTGGTATFGQGITQTGGLTTADGTLNSPLTLTGGTLTGNGTVNGAVVNNGGTVKAGDPFGTLAVNGPFTQTTDGTLDAQFTQAQASLLAVTGVVTTGGALSVNYLGTVPYTLGSGPFTFLDYGTLGTEGTNTLGLTQYFTNETALTNDTGLITGTNGFTYELLNNTAAGSLQLQVLTAGTPAVPEASTPVSLGLLLSLGGAGLWSVKRRRTAAAR